MAIPNLFKKKETKAMVFRVGEGINEVETKTAYEKIRTPNLKADVPDIPNLGQAIKKEFSIREEPVEVRRPFEIEPIKTKAPPIVTQLGSLGNSIVEAIPRMFTTLYGEFVAPERKTGKVDIGIDARRLGYEESEYKTAAQEVTDAINAGESPILAPIRIVSEKVLDLAFGAQLTTNILKIVERQLLKGGIEGKIASWETLGRPMTIEEANANKVAQTSKALQSSKNLPLEQREKIVSRINNNLNKAVKNLKEKGLPTLYERTKYTTAKIAEVGSRETKNFKEFLTPDLKIKRVPLGETTVISGQLPGTRARPGQAPAFGLSAQEVERVGYGEAKIVKALEGEKKMPDDIYNLFNKKLQELQDIVDVSDEMRKILPKNLTVNEAIIELNRNSGLGINYSSEEGLLELKKDITDLGYTDIINAPSFKKILPTDYAITSQEKTIQEFILKGEARVVSREGENVVQIKRDGKWVTMPDEKTAIETLTPKKEIEPVQKVSTKYSEEGIPLALNKREQAIIEGKIKPGEKLPKEEVIRVEKEKSINQKIKDIDEAKSAFKAFEMEPFESEVKTKVPEDVLSDVSRRALVGSSDFNVIKSPVLYTRDIYRNLESFFRGYFPTIKKNLLDPLDMSKGRYIDMKKKLADDTYNEVVVKLGIKKGSKESAAVMDYGERNLEEDFAPANPMTKEDLISTFGKEKAENIIQADSYFRKQYDELIDWINVERKNIYGAVWERKKLLDEEIELLSSKIQEKRDILKNKKRTDTLAYIKIESQLRNFNRLLQTRKDLLESDLWWRGKIIPKRKDYYRHYFEMTEGFKALKDLLTQDANIPTRLAGLSPDTKPKSKFLQFAQGRTGNLSQRDAVGSFLNYIPAASYAIHIDPNIEGFRRLAESLRASKNNLYSPMIEYITDFANDLAGKTNEIDRGIQKVTGRKIFRVINWVNNRVKANVILGNVSSSLAQIFNVPQGIGSAKQYSIEGATRSFAQIFTKNIPMQKSAFIKERFAEDISKKFYTGMLDKTGSKPKEFALWMLTALDEVGTKFIWNSHYAKAVAQMKKSPNSTMAWNGIVYSDPIKFADDITRKLIAGRGIGEIPLVQKSKMFQLIAPFQLEVGNAWWVMKDFVSKKDFTGIVMFFVTSFLLNKAVEKIRGSGVVFDPIQALWEGFKAFKEDENKLRGGVKLGGRVLGEVFSNIPLGQTLASMYPEFGWGKGDWAISREELFGKGDPTRYGTGLVAFKGIQDPLFKLVTPFGGAQIKRSIEGTKFLEEGGAFSKGGQLQFLAPTSVLGKIQAVVFGKTSGGEAKEYFEQGEVSKSEKSKIQPIYDTVQSLKNSGKEDEAQTIVDELSDEDYEIYKKYRTQEKTKETLKGKKEFLPRYLEIQKIKKENLDKAKEMVEALSDEEYKYYALIKKQVEKDNKAEEGEEPKYEEGEVQTVDSLLKTVTLYAKAIGTDPVTAFNRIFTGQKIRYIANDAIVVERMSVEESQKVKEERGGKNVEFKLDHLVPLQLGGSNNENNLVLVPTEKWESFTPIENYLGNKLRDEEISKKEAQDLIIKFKAGEITADEIYSKDIQDEVSMIIDEFRKQSGNFEGVPEKAYNYYKQELARNFGKKAIKELDDTMEKENLSINYA